jgi:hypothetical protein
MSCDENGGASLLRKVVRVDTNSSTNMAGNGNRLKGSQLGYYGKGPPDLDTLLALQDMHAAAVLACGLPAAILAKYNRLQELMTKPANKDKETETFEEIAALWKELMPILHFKEDDVDWDN